MPCKLQDVIKEKLSLVDLQQHFAVTDLKKAKVPVKDLVDKGYTSKQLVVFDSYTLSDLKDAGIPRLRTLVEDEWGQSDLIAAGFPRERVISEIAAIDALRRRKAAGLSTQSADERVIHMRPARTWTDVIKDIIDEIQGRGLGLGDLCTSTTTYRRGGAALLLIGPCLLFNVFTSPELDNQAWKDKCGLQPYMGCLFFDADALRQHPSETTVRVQSFMTELLHGTNVPALSSLLLNVMVHFFVVRLGGIPVPFISGDGIGTTFWVIFMVLQTSQYLTVMLVVIMDFLALDALRFQVCPRLNPSKSCVAQPFVASAAGFFGKLISRTNDAPEEHCPPCALIQAHTSPPWPLRQLGVGDDAFALDIAFYSTIFSNYTFIGRLLLMFINAYALSSGLKVFFHALAFRKQYKVDDEAKYVTLYIEEATERKKQIKDYHDKVGKELNDLDDKVKEMEENMKIRPRDRVPGLRAERVEKEREFYKAKVDLHDAEEECYKREKEKAENDKETHKRKPQEDIEKLKAEEASVGQGLHIAVEKWAFKSGGGFMEGLPNRPQPIPLASFHYFLAYFGAVSSILIALCSDRPLTSICYAPTSVLLILIIYSTYKAVPFLVKRINASRGPLGWFAALSMNPPKFADAIRFPLVFYARWYGEKPETAPNEDFPESYIIGDFWIIGGGMVDPDGETKGHMSDAGFLTLAFGLQTFFACLAIAPMMNFCTWLSVPMMLGTLSSEQRAEFIYLGYRAQSHDVATVLRWEWHVGWPALFGMHLEEIGERIGTFLTDPSGYFHELFGTSMELLNLANMPHLDVARFKDGTKLLLFCDILLIALKVSMMLMINAWMFYVPRFKDTPRLLGVKFTDIIPDDNSFKDKTREEEQINSVMKEYRELMQATAESIIGQSDKFKAFLEDPTKWPSVRDSVDPNRKREEDFKQMMEKVQDLEAKRDEDLRIARQNPKSAGQ